MSHLFFTLFCLSSLLVLGNACSTANKQKEEKTKKEKPREEKPREDKPQANKPVPPSSSTPPLENYSPPPGKEFDLVRKALHDVDTTLASLQSVITPKQVVGLKNCGNTCFINAVLQVLLNTDYLRRYFTHSPNPVINHSNDDAAKITKAFVQLFHNYYAEPARRFIDTKAFIALKDAHLWQFEPGEQGDADEFWRVLGTNLHEALNVMEQKIPYQTLNDSQQADFPWLKAYLIGREGHSLFSRVIVPYVKKTVTCESGSSNIFYSPGNFPMQVTLGKSSQALPELLTEAEEWEFNIAGATCSDKSKVTKKKEEIAELPPAPGYVAFQLKRFSATQDSSGKMQYKKVETPLHFPLQFTFKGKLLSLYGVILHSGSFKAGHYTSYVTNADNHWYYCNDETVSSVQVEQVLADQKKAYLLFYKID